MPSNAMCKIVLLMGIGLTTLAAVVPLQSSAAPMLSSLYSFQGGADGAAPISGLVADATETALYGTTPSGGGTGCGGAGCGVVYRLTPPPEGQAQWSETIIYSFTGGADGSVPKAGLTLGADGVFYGTTSAGGTFGYGTVFSLTPPASGQTTWTEAVIHSFANGNDGAIPVSPLLLDKSGILYGTTFGSESPSKGGNVFRLTPPHGAQAEWQYTVIWFFMGGRYDGLNPQTGVTMDSAGNLFGTTSYNSKSSNGNHFGCGTVFKLTPGQTPDGFWTESTLAFLQTDSLNLCKPSGLLYMDAAGVLYDTTLNYYPVGQYGTHGGVLSLTPPGAGQTAWAQANIDSVVPYTFFPYSGVIPDSLGNLYGTSAGNYMRGKAAIAGATVFELVRPPPGGTWTQKVLARFDITNGALPKSPLLMAKDGTLYGTTQAGGTYNFGTVFALARPGK